MDSTAGTTGTPEQPVEVYDFGKKRTKKSKKADTAKAVELVDGTGEIFVKGKAHEYQDLLTRIQTLIGANNPELQGSKKYTIKPPQVARVGSRRVCWTNFKEICDIMNRSPDHVVQFVLAELGTDGSVAADGRHLILKGRYGPKHLESLLRKYITEYVTCQMCKSANTRLERDSRTRLFNINCGACGASRSVTTIRSGFHAVARGERMKAKNAPK